jgi:hypothetical protein
MKKNITQEQCKDTGLAIILILLLVAWVTEATTYIGPVIIILILTMTWPKIFTMPARLWFSLSRLMGETVSKIILTLVFFLIVVPIGLIRKLLGKDSMGLKKWKKGDGTVFIQRHHTFSPADIEKLF